MTDSISLRRWHQLMASLGLPASEVVYHQLIAAYREPQRYYHSLQHLADCLDHLDRIKTLLQSPEEVELALWFHDAIYQPRSQSNEVDSAAWLRTFWENSQPLEQREGDRPAVDIERICQHILATQHHQTTTDPDRQFLLDIDLAILGSPTATFDQFEQNIRREYAWVPEQVYCQKRIQVLTALLGSKNQSTSDDSAEQLFVYKTTHFREQYEDVARHNLRRMINILRTGLA